MYPLTSYFTLNEPALHTYPFSFGICNPQFMYFIILCKETTYIQKGTIMIAKSICDYEADYSTIPGDRILPFVFSLNLEDSILYPSEGEYQKFCYDITAVGQDSPHYADLSHFLFGICSTIAKEDITEITVSINGKPQTVVWGDNVEIKTADKPDNPTGCTGLKFDFPLNKITGFMKVCISLRTPYSIGPVNVCLYGGGTTCCGEPVVSTGTQCMGNQTSCSFTITQSLCIEIPISFGAVIETGSAVVKCGTPSEEECDCSEPDDEEDIIPQNTVEARERRFFNR